ncbi:hypothetical protein MSIMFB_03264 [Mycobacterium simulans]|uniref:Uncharacterized protein n=1 Tax=Mycobacterium simulans TaxID=627089 RepID=A0A7Z7NAJ2_9MYCO|nr:hypothetical protein [Mycobacterium simulans]SOJ55785.1 hypothetical protein MSIMFB_03264 [Mycobacterium simulans]
MKEPVDWIRATFTGAIAGGFLWAIMAKAMSVIAHEHISTRFFYTFVSETSLAIVTVGVILFLCTRTSFWRTLALGVILAPLTGWSMLLVITVLFVIPSQQMS